MSRNKGFDDGIERLKLNLYNITGFPNELTTGNPSEIIIKGTDIADQMHETYVSKDSDYASDGKPMGNLRISEEIGVKPWRACLLRMMDKMSRIKSFKAQGVYVVADEKITDTLIDLANYSLLAEVLFSEEDENIEVVNYFDQVVLYAVRCKLLYDYKKDFPGTAEWHAEAFDDLNNSFEKLKEYSRN